MNRALAKPPNRTREGNLRTSGKTTTGKQAKCSGNDVISVDPSFPDITVNAVIERWMSRKWYRE